MALTTISQLFHCYLPHKIGTNVPGGVNEVLQDLVLSKAMEKGEPVEMIYLDTEGHFTQRRIRICSLHDQTVEAYCYQRKAFRRFRKMGILAAVREEKYGQRK